MPLHKETCCECGVKKLSTTWESWIKAFAQLERERDKNVHIVRVMKPIIDQFAADYFEPEPDRGVCGYCDAGAGCYIPDRHSEECPALIAWRLKPMVDQLLAKEVEGK